MLIGPDVEVVEAHLPFKRKPSQPASLLFGGASIAAVELTARAFGLETMWHRGRFAPSLYADSPARSRAWLDGYARQGLPMLDGLAERFATRGGMWLWLARENGREEHGIQRRSGLTRVDFERVRSTAVQQDVLYQLPLWSAPGEVPTQKPLLYWTDPGVLHWHCALTEEMLLDWTGRVFPHDRERLQLLRAKSWEGFVISCLLRAAGTRASGRVWRAIDGEIDLILDWPDSRSTWAIEVTLGRNKELRRAFADGCVATQAERRIIVFNQIVGKPRVKGAADVLTGVEWMSLEEALREVRSGP